MIFTFKSSFAEQLRSFIAFKVSLGFSESTYIEKARSLDSFCFTHYSSIAELTEDIVTSWVCFNSDDGTAKLDKVRFARAFGNYLKGLGKNAYVIPSEYTPKQVKSQIPYLFSKTELTKFFREVDRIEIPNFEFSSTMLSVYFRLVYTCGLRPGEARKLKVNNINIDTGEISIVHTKNSIDRIVVMSEAMRELSETYLRIRNVIFNDNDFFFPNTCGGCPSDAWFQKYFKKAFACSCPDIPEQQLPFVRVYNLRHQFASDVIHKWINDGEDLENRLPYLQAFMGHTDISQTAYYIHLLPDKLKNNAGIYWSHMNSLIPEVESNE